jgi:WD40 repeat protein
MLLVPFKFVKSNKEHSRFVQCVRYSPNGNHFVSSSSDAKIILYDGKEGDKIGEFTENAHTGTVFSVSWDGEGSKVLSASADMTAKIWDVSTMKCVK